MAKSPRINVSVTAEQHALLLELASLRGGSASGFLRMIVDQVTPQLRVVVPLLRSAVDEQKKTYEEGAQILADLIESMGPTDTPNQPDLLDMAVRARDEKRPRGTGEHGSPQERRQPPYSNTGVRNG